MDDVLYCLRENLRLGVLTVKNRLVLLFCCVVAILITFSCVAPQNNDNNLPQNNPPNVPRDPNPPHGATGVRWGTTTLNWECEDPDGDPLTFEVYFGTDPTPTNLATATSQKSYYPGELNLSTTYYWKIVAKDDKGKETPGPIWRFTTTSCPACR